MKLYKCCNNVSTYCSSYRSYACLRNVVVIFLRAIFIQFLNYSIIINLQCCIGLYVFVKTPY